MEYSGSIYNLSPFLSLVSVEQANRQLQRELISRSALGYDPGGGGSETLEPSMTQRFSNQHETKIF